MGDFYLYVSAFWTKWWAVVSAFALFGLDPAVRAYWPWGARQLDRLSAQTRRRIEIVILVIAVFYAGFSAWSDEHEARIKLEQGSSRGIASIWQISDDQKARLSAGLKLSPDENYAIQINSAPSCDPCDEYARDLRDIVNSVPGWKANGGALIFRPQKPWRGLVLFARNKNKDAPPIKKIVAAFSSAGLPLNYEDFEDTSAELVAVIVVGRRNR